jgi:hypothetical protein
MTTTTDYSAALFPPPCVVSESQMPAHLDLVFGSGTTVQPALTGKGPFVQQRFPHWMTSRNGHSQAIEVFCELDLSDLSCRAWDVSETPARQIAVPRDLHLATVAAGGAEANGRYKTAYEAAGGLAGEHARMAAPPGARLGEGLDRPWPFGLPLRP